MSLWADAKIRELLVRVEALELKSQPTKFAEVVRADKAAVIAVIDVRAAYEKKFGKPPHHRMKIETIMEALK